MAATNAEVYQQSQMPIPMPTPSLNPNINSAPTPGPNAMSVYEDCQSPVDTSVSGMYPGDRGSRVVSQPAPLLDQCKSADGMNSCQTTKERRTVTDGKYDKLQHIFDQVIRPIFSLTTVLSSSTVKMPKRQTTPNLYLSSLLL